MINFIKTKNTGVFLSIVLAFKIFSFLWLERGLFSFWIVKCSLKATKSAHIFSPFPPQIFLSPSENSSDTSKKTYMIQWLSRPDTDYPIQKISSSKRPIYNSAFAFSCMPHQMWTLPSALFFFLYGTFSWIFRVLSWEESFSPCTGLQCPMSYFSGDWAALHCCSGGRQGVGCMKQNICSLL